VKAEIDLRAEGDRQIAVGLVKVDGGKNRIRLPMELIFCGEFCHRIKNLFADQ
jgi:hypothetical protein